VLSTSPARAVGAASLASVAAQQALRAFPPAHPRWQRENYRGRPVTLANGIAVTAGAAAGAVAAGRPDGAAVTIAAGALGLYDDLYGDSHARGLAGHLRALREGRLTTGMVKLAGLVALGGGAAAMLRRRGVDAAVDVVLVAGSANLVNLLDLRPGRALKAAGLCAAALALPPRRPTAPSAISACPGAKPVGAGLAAAAAVALPIDLAETAMLGDCGANATGALLGWCIAGTASRAGRVVAALAVVGLTLASERMSFSEVIARTEWLRRLDAWGRRT
jgi:UDP-GlcNAc:undecaprenyl-phosphate GlcNAc-1-phosphate transferase